MSGVFPAPRIRLSLAALLDRKMTTPALPPSAAGNRRDDLEFLAELCQVVASNAELQPILDWTVRRVTTMLSADEGSIRLMGPDESAQSLKTLVRSEQPGISAGSWPAPVSFAVMTYLKVRGEPLASPDLLNDPRFPTLRGTKANIRSVLAIPLRVESRFTGMLAVTRMSPGRQWRQEEIQLLSIVAANAAGVIEQARLRAEVLEKQRLVEESRRLDGELKLARDIQMSMLPGKPLLAGPWEVCGRVLSERLVGGDGFDYYMLGEDRFAVAIADVSGKGVPAALLMSNVHASLRAFCDGRLPIPEAIRHLNASVARTSSTEQFVTLFYAEFELSSGLLTYTNAGHNFPIVRRRNGALLDLSQGGAPLGALERPEYVQGQVALAPGDAVLFSSDGVTEARNPANGQFGEARLRELWSARGGARPAQVIDEILGAVGAFRASAQQSDDITVVVMSSTEGAGGAAPSGLLGRDS